MGGRMKQEIYKDDYSQRNWDLGHSSRCFIHILNSINWKEITGQKPPELPPTKKDYQLNGIPWFEYYSEKKALNNTNIFSKLRTIKPFDNDSSITPKFIKKITSKVSEWNVE